MFKTLFTQHLKTLQECGFQQQNIKKQRFDFPLTHYWIASSHNTYLIKDQLFGPANICGYLLFLDTFRGGCVEIDPGYVVFREEEEKRGEKEEREEKDVTVTHVMTPTGSIFLSDLFKAISQWVEKNADAMEGPIILSFDNKKITDTQDQAVIWTLLNRFFGLSKEKSYCHEQENGCKWYFDATLVQKDNLVMLSPSALRGKVLVKWEECHVLNKEGTSCGIKGGKKALISQTLIQNVSKDEKATEGEEKYIHLAKSKCNLAKSPCPNEFWSVTSMHHPFEYEKISKTVIFNTIDNFIRIYPSPLSIASGNYNPIGSWLNGAQMVALNTQKQDKDWHINYCMFKNTAFRLKPLWMREKEALQRFTPLKKTITFFFNAKQDFLVVFHPSGRESKRTRGKGEQSITFEHVDPTIAIFYAEKKDKRGKEQLFWQGAAEVDREKTVGEGKCCLARWERPKEAFGIQFMGPFCSFAPVETLEIPFYYVWSA